MKWFQLRRDALLLSGFVFKDHAPGTQLPPARCMRVAYSSFPRFRLPRRVRFGSLRMDVNLAKTDPLSQYLFSLFFEIFFRDEKTR